jgi:hypothetical protein
LGRALTALIKAATNTYIICISAFGFCVAVLCTGFERTTAWHFLSLGGLHLPRGDSLSVCVCVILVVDGCGKKLHGLPTSLNWTHTQCLLFAPESLLCAEWARACVCYCVLGGFYSARERKAGVVLSVCQDYSSLIFAGSKVNSCVNPYRLMVCKQ